MTPFPNHALSMRLLAQTPVGIGDHVFDSDDHGVDHGGDDHDDDHGGDDHDDDDHGGDRGRIMVNAKLLQFPEK